MRVCLWGVIWGFGVLSLPKFFPGVGFVLWNKLEIQELSLRSRWEKVAPGATGGIECRHLPAGEAGEREN